MTKFIGFILKNRLLVMAVSLLILVAGYTSYKQLPIDAFPDVSPNLVQVFTTTDGLAPEEVEKYVTYPVEVVMNGLPNVVKIRSVSNFGLSIVNIYFEDDTDLYFARQLVNERIQEAREQIPKGFGEPEMGPISTGMGLILFYYLDDETGQYSLEELRSIQDWIVKFHLQTVPGVTEVLGIGGYEKQYQVIVNPLELLQYDISIQDVIEKIQSNNLNVGAQFIEKNSEEFIVRSVGLASGIEDIENIILKSESGTPVLLKQVANVEIGGAIRRGIQTRDGIGEVVSGMVVKLYGTNSSTVIGQVESKMEEINNILPKGIKIVPYYEQKTLVTACVNTVSNALLQGIILVIIILFIFMGSIRPSIVVALSILFSVLFAMIGMNYFNISANLMSFGGLAIAIGMLVDGSIVVVENIERILKTPSKNMSKTKQITKAFLEVIQPVSFAIIIIIIVFLPLFTLEGVEGKTFSPLAYTIVIAMFGSLIYAMLIAPVLSTYLLKTPKKINERKDNILVRLLNNIYQPIITYFVNHRGVAVSLAGVLIAIGIMTFPQLGSEFTPKLNEGSIVVRVSMAPSISLSESKNMTLAIEKRLINIPEITSVVTRIGRGEVGAHADPVNSAEIYVLLVDKVNWRNDANQEDIENIIRETLEDVPGVLVNLTQPIAMNVDELLEGIKAELAIKLFGDDLDILKEKADEIADVIRKVNGADDVQVDQISGTPQLLMNIDRKAIARYGINISDVQEVIHSAVGGETVGEIFEGNRRFDILVRYEEKYRNTADAISNIVVQSPDGVNIPLSELVEIEEITGPRQITRENNQRFITVQCNVSGRDIGSFVEEGKLTIDKNISFPVGYLVSWGGQFRLQQEANKRLAVVIPITLIVIFLLLFSSFNSLKNSLLILLNIPLALVGGVVALWLTGQNLSVPSSVGFIALFGIALENGMVLLSYMNQLVRDGMSVKDASIMGAKLRLRPVLMTALTTALGLLPLLFTTGTGSEVQRPLATVVVGGLLTSTILTLLVIPALYQWFAKEEESKTKIFPRFLFEIPQHFCKLRGT